MRQQKVSFKSSADNKVVGIISDTGNKDDLIMILCHGFTTGKHSETYKTLEKNLNKIGVSTLRFDFFGHGESEGKFENLTISEAVDDILQAIKFLEKQGYTKIGLLGKSFGGSASIMAASKTNKLSLLVLVAPVSDYSEKEKLTKTKEYLNTWKNTGYVMFVSSDGREHRINYTFVEDFKDNPGFEAAKKIKVPTLIVHGDKDASVPIELSMKTQKLIPDCKLQVIKDCDHLFSQPKHFDEMISSVVKFVNENRG